VRLLSQTRLTEAHEQARAPAGRMLGRGQGMQALDGKRGILAALEHALNDDATVEDAIDYLLYLQGIEEGLEDEQAGRMVPHEEIVEMIKSWAR